MYMEIHIMTLTLLLLPARLWHTLLRIGCWGTRQQVIWYAVTRKGPYRRRSILHESAMQTVVEKATTSVRSPFYVASNMAQRCRISMQSIAMKPLLHLQLL